MKQTIKKVIAIILIMLILCTQNISKATDAQTPEDMTVESARAQIANWAIAFLNSEGSKWQYSKSFSARAATYQGGYPQDKYIFDCVGLVSYIIHYSIGINYYHAEIGDQGFVTPQNNVRDTTHFELHYISSNDIPQAGDILIATEKEGGSTENHVAIYCGNGNLVDIWGSKEAEIRSVNSDWRENGWTDCKFSKFARLKSIDGASFTPIEGGTILPSPAENVGNNGNTGDGTIVDLDEIADKFKYQGMPSDIGVSKEDGIFRWLFNSLAGIWDYITGAIFSIIRIPGVGLASITERKISSELEKANKTYGTVESDIEDIGQIFNIEDIIFNKIPILDINFFSNKAAGQDVQEGSVVNTLRNVVSTWYVSFRNLVIMSLAIIIIYVGIRMAIASIPENKAKYKKMLFGWGQALIIVLTIHYIMLIVINLNEVIVNTIKETQIQIAQERGEESIYETIRTRAYDVRFGIGFPAMIMYVALVIIWLRFLWVYIKRSFTMIILVITAPYIGAKYAIDSSSGKKGTSFTSWLYDFVMNVFLQSVHAIVYTALISTALNLSTQSLMGFVIALVLFNFMLQADEIFRNIFNFDKSKLSAETAKKQDRKEIMKDFGGIVFIGQMAKGGAGLIRFVGGTAVGIGKVGYRTINRINPNVGGGINHLLDMKDSFIESKTAPQKDDKDGILKDIKDSLYYNAKIRRLSRQSGSTGIKARRLKAKLKAQRSKRYKSNYKFVKGSVTGVGSVIFAIPLTVVNPVAGVSLATKGIITLSKLGREDNREEAKSKSKVKRILNGYKKLGPYKIYYANKKAKEKYEKKRNKIYKSIRQIDEINKKEEEIRNKVIRQINEINKQEGEIRNKFANILSYGNTTEDEINIFKQTLSDISLEGNTSKITDAINRYLKDNNIKDIDKSTINGIIDNVVENLGANGTLSDSVKGNIRRRAKSRISRENAKADRDNPDNKYSEDYVSKIIIEKLVDRTVDNKFRNIAKDIISLESKINEAEKTAKTNYRHVNKFLENL